MRNSVLLPVAVAISLLTTACGSGGGGGGNDAAQPPPVVPPPIAPPPPDLFRLSGTLSASTSQAVDGDNNDPLAQLRPNDTVATAQPVTNPVTLGGYVNQPGTGAPGRSREAGDRNDYFQVELLAGQRVTLLVADFEQADVDLYLYDSQENIVDFSVLGGQTETLVIDRDGTYAVNAFAYEGASNYILAIGNQNTLGDRGAPNRDIIPWQTVVTFRETGAPEADGGSDDSSRRLGLQQRAGDRGRGRLMALQRGLDGGIQAAGRARQALDKKRRIQDPALLARWETLNAIKSLRRDPQVKFAEPNYRVRACFDPNDEGYPFQWHYPLINLPAAWDTTTGSSEVIVAVIDTGILSNHPDLQGQWVAGYDFVRDQASAGDGDGIDPDPEDVGFNPGTTSSSFHGTHVSGTVAAVGNNGLGVTGVAYDALIMPLRALGADGEGTSYDVDQAIRFAAGLANDSGTVPDRRADIINLSLGGGSFSQASQALLREVRSAGVTVVAAAGNEASSLPSYPAAYDGVISVSAVDAQRAPAGYSNRGSSIDLAAPGGNNGVDLNGDGYPDGVLSTGGQLTGSVPGFAYSFLTGTSMAAPHVSGVLALMKSVSPGLTPAVIDTLLTGGDLSDDLGAPGRDDAYGYGLINAQRAVNAALQASGSPAADRPRLSASTATLNFSANGTVLELTLRNDGGGELQLLELSGSEPWLTLTPGQVDDRGLGLYRVSVTREGLATGVYAANIIARSSVNTVYVRVIMAVATGDDSPELGAIYVLLVDADSEEVIAETMARSGGDGYDFEFPNVPPGQYRVYAGSDADNDRFICDPGEACGAWLTLDQPILIELGANAAGIDFPVDYLVSTPSISASASSAGPPNRSLSRARPGSEEDIRGP